MDTVLLLALASSMVRATTPLLFAALGGLFSERSGVVNIALEGIILFGAMAAAITAQLVEAPHLANNPAAVVPYAPWIGVLAGMLVGGLVGWIHAVVSIRYRADQIISGTAINLMALGIPAVILSGLYNNTATSAPIRNRLPTWELFGIDQLAFSPLVYLAFLLVPITWFVVFRTPFGLRLRAVGEHPAAADSLGVNVFRMRYAGVVLSGMLAGLGGAYLSIGNLNQFVSEMSGGRGFIALAALIFGKWHPLGVLGATLLFGAFQATEVLLGGGRLLPPTLVQSLPYVLTMMVLAGFVGRSIAPKASGKSFVK
ncbi:MAG TPA: ABC transporter permease [Trueperaceae bacterium]|nr:ABC transporter permease [Trueperaceae bacterium]